MPIYNVARYVERALMSALNQTYQNIEIICVDDCGKDNSMEIVERLLKLYDKDSKIKIIRHDHNRGLSAARNTGLDNMHGEYVYFMDSDDEITTDCIEKLEALTEKYPGVEMVVGNMSVPIQPNDAEEKKMEGRDFSQFPEYSDNKEWIVWNMFDFSNGYFIPSTSVNKLQKKSFFEDNGLRFVEGLIQEDEKMTFDCAECIKSIAFYQPVTYIRYVNKGSITTSLTAKRNLSTWIRIIIMSYPNFREPHRTLKLLYSIEELVHHSINMPKGSEIDVLKTKILVIKLCRELNKCGGKNAGAYMWEYLFTPHRMMRLTKRKKYLAEKYSLSELLKLN